MAWGADDVRETASLTMLQNAMKHWWGQDIKLEDITPNDFLDSDKRKVIRAIVNVTSEPDSARVFLKWSNKLDKELSSDHPYADLVNKLKILTWNSFKQAVQESGIHKNTIISTASLKGLGANTLLEKTSYMREDWINEDTGLDDD